MIQIAFSILIGAVLIAAGFALFAVMLSSRISRQEEIEEARFTQAMIDQVGKK